MTTRLPALQEWVDSVAKLTQPEDIHWCNGSEAEYKRLISQMNRSGDLIELDQDSYPNCYLHRSDPTDVARVEHLTYICTQDRDDAGPNNHWMSPNDAHEKVDLLFENAMQGRTMYVIPYCMGPIDSPYARLGVEITDSPYVVVNMKIMTRMGDAALERGALSRTRRREGSARHAPGADDVRPPAAPRRLRARALRASRPRDRAARCGAGRAKREA